MLYGRFSMRWYMIQEMWRQGKPSTEKTVTGSISAMRISREPIRSELFCGYLPLVANEELRMEVFGF